MLNFYQYPYQSTRIMALIKVLIFSSAIAFGLAYFGFNGCYAYMIEHHRYLNVLGIACLLSVAYLFSRNKARIDYQLVLNALALQLLMGFLVLKTGIGQKVVSSISVGISSLYQFSDQGIRFVFGSLAEPTGAWGFIFAIKVLPIIIFFGALTSLLFYAGIIQRFVLLMNKVVQPLLGTSGPETLCAIANSFLGQTEAPLLIRHYLHNMTTSEIFVVMVSGMATISGSILAVFAAMGVPAQHMLTASVMAIPASILIAKILIPETERSLASTSDNKVIMRSPARNVFDALAAGTSDGLSLAVNVAAMLIVFISLIALLNSVLAFGGSLIGMTDLSLGSLFSLLFAPVAYVLGFTGEDATRVAQLLGTKVTVNELVAYSQMVTMNLSDRTVAILTYALCGFSNFSCIGIQIGGIGALVPEKRLLLTQLGLFAVLGSSLANLLSALIAGILL